MASSVCVYLSLIHILSWISNGITYVCTGSSCWLVSKTAFTPPPQPHANNTKKMARFLFIVSASQNEKYLQFTPARGRTRSRLWLSLYISRLWKWIMVARWESAFLYDGEGTNKPYRKGTGSVLLSLLKTAALRGKFVNSWKGEYSYHIDYEAIDSRYLLTFKGINLAARYLKMVGKWRRSQRTTQLWSGHLTVTNMC